jgi:small subunit ribosomal protein S6
MQDRRYETLVLIHPEQGEGGAKDVAARIRSLIEDQGGTIGQVQDWGGRELAYVIAKQRRATYVLFEYRATPKALTEVERQLKLMDAVLRFVSVRQDENAPPTPARFGPRPEREESEDAGTEAQGDTESAPVEENA